MLRHRLSWHSFCIPVAASFADAGHSELIDLEIQGNFFEELRMI
jgi:hypothetical protein